MAAALIRLFLVYSLLPSALAACTLILKNAQPAMFVNVTLFACMWFALDWTKTTEKGKRRDPFLAIFLMASGVGIIIPLVRSLTDRSTGIPAMLFEVGSLILEITLVSAYIEFERREIPRIGHLGMSLILYGWSNLCAAPLVKYMEPAGPRSVGEIPNWSLLLATSITFFMMGAVFLLVGFITANRKKT